MRITIEGAAGGQFDTAEHVCILTEDRGNERLHFSAPLREKRKL
jgi:hypothetical protein